MLSATSIALIWMGGFALLFLPGALIHRLLRLPSHPDWLVMLSTQVGLGLAFWPLFLLWSTQIGWHWTSSAAQIFAAALCVAGAAALLWAPARWPVRLWQFRRQAAWLAVFASIAAITVTTRLLHVRALALPAWVDPLHHVAIVRLLLAEGAIPATFDPFIPGGFFNYHWGYHAVVAWLAWLLGSLDAFAVADLMLHFGQLLNVLTVLMLYAGGRILFASRRAGLLAAAIVATISWFPAYFLSWGRYTHLTGVLLVAPALIALWRMRAAVSFGRIAAAALLLGGVALVHVRVAFFAALLALLLVTLWVMQRRWRALVGWLVAALAALLLTLPWWLWLGGSTWARAIVSLRTDNAAAWLSFNSPDWGVLWAPRNDLLIGLGSGGLSPLFGWQTASLGEQIAGALWLSILIAAAVGAWRRPRLRRPTERTAAGWLLMMLWIAVTALLLLSDRLGLPTMRFIHINAGVITLYAPLSLAVGGLVAWLLGLLASYRYAQFLAGFTALIVTIWGASGMTVIVNPATVLATPADRAALIWIRDNLPADARFAVNVRPWMNGVYAGSDGGYWIPVLTDRASIMPPVLYSGALPAATRTQMNESFARLATSGNLDDPSLRAELAAQGVTHLYLSEGRGTLRAENIDGREFAQLLYRQDGVSIYALNLSSPAQ